MKFILTATLLVSSFCAFPQKVNKLVKEDDVTRIIRTLAADEMMGRSAMDEKSITKAAAFIAGEFADIGLQPLKGATDFFQNMSLYEKIEMTSLSASVGGNPVAPGDVMLYADAENVSLATGAPTSFIEKDKPFRSALRPFFSDSVSKVVFVAPGHEKEFREIRGYFSGPRLGETGKSKKASVAFILGNPAAEFSITASQKHSPFPMMNVAGMLEGKNRKDEIVVFSGHYDHIGLHSPVEGDSIANGADDDASGTTAVIELARYFKKMKNNERTLIFVAFTGEEIGGYGSRYFSKQLDPEKVVAMFNIEMIGKPSKWGQNSAFITGFEKSDFGEILQKNLAGTPFRFEPDPYPQENLFYRSDNATLARLGVPAHTISTDQIDIDPYYHTVNDEVETLDMGNITSAIRAIALSAKSIVSGEDTPRRIDKKDVR